VAGVEQRAQLPGGRLRPDAAHPLRPPGQYLFFSKAQLALVCSPLLCCGLITQMGDVLRVLKTLDLRLEDKKVVDCPCL
jgi:hypothetical protein